MTIPPACSDQPVPAGAVAPPPVTVVVCTTCRRAGDDETAPCAGTVLADAVAAAADPSAVTVRPVQCLANCSRGPSAAIARAGAWTYVFGGLGAADGTAALLAGARLLAESPDGLLPWRGRPEPLKRGLTARIPPLEPAP